MLATDLKSVWTVPTTDAKPYAKPRTFDADEGVVGRVEIT
jgi:hypothetical protein